MFVESVLRASVFIVLLLFWVDWFTACGKQKAVQIQPLPRKRQNCHTSPEGIHLCVDCVPAVRSTFLIFCLLLLLASAIVVGLRSIVPQPTRLDGLPRLTLWAWERSEDFRQLDPQRYAIAYLDQTITITDQPSSTPRLQPIRFATGSSKLIAVVRIETPTQFAILDSPDLLNTVADLIVVSARKPAVAALQIDFDATRSQRAFYARLLREVRRRMPDTMPLSITALASWCGSDSWLEGLPIDEAVPMLFRMGENPRSLRQTGWRYPIREPLCTTSIGVSTDEPWPDIATAHRVYVFHPRSWNPQAAENARKLVER
jgi:hypothetical protein